MNDLLTTIIRCKLCNSKFVHVRGSVFLCPKCWKRIIRRKRRNINMTANTYNISWAEADALVSRCVACGNSDFVEIHHIIPARKNGGNKFDNYVGLCPNCHTLIHKRRITLTKLLWCWDKTIPQAKELLRKRLETRQKNNPIYDY